VFEGGSDVGIVGDHRRKSGGLGGAEMLGFLILMAQDSGHRLGKVLGDELSGEMWKCCQMASADCSKESRGDWTAHGGMVVGG
jgi:hypothetical protein